MKTKIAFLNPNQISGCVTLISYGNTTICIDYGQNLPGNVETVNECDKLYL